MLADEFRERFSKLEKAVDNVYYTTQQINSDLIALRETVDAKFKMLEVSIKSLSEIHESIREEHEKDLNTLTNGFKNHDIFINNIKGALKIIAYIIGIVLALWGANKLL